MEKLVSGQQGAARPLEVTSDLFEETPTEKVQTEEGGVLTRALLRTSECSTSEGPLPSE